MRRGQSDDVRVAWMGGDRPRNRLDARRGHLVSRRRKTGRTVRAAAVSHLTPSARAPITLVLADSYHLVRQGIRCLLEKEKDFAIIGETADGLKVSRLVERRKPRVLVVAMALPGLNGLQVTRQVRRRSPDTAVILLSMFENERYVIEALRYGAAGYVSKRAQGVELVRA